MDTQFVRDRITQLRLKKGVSEYQMSYDLGHSRSYVYNISSGKSLPPMAEFLQICNYFDITPSQFFDESEENPALLQTAIEELRKLNDDDLLCNGHFASDCHGSVTNAKKALAFSSKCLRDKVCYSVLDSSKSVNFLHNRQVPSA